MIEHEIGAPQMQTTADPGTTSSMGGLEEKMYPTMPAAEIDRPQSGSMSGDSESYADIRTPQNVKFDAAALGDFKAFAKEQGLSHAQAQEALDFAAPKIRAAIEAPYKQWQARQTRWESEVKAHFGSNLDASIETARLVFQASDTNPFIGSAAEAAALKKALIQTGAGNHPAIVKTFYKMGQWLKARQGPQHRLLNSMYPSME